MRQANVAEYEGEDEVEIETEPEDSDLAEEYRESATFVLQQLICNQKNPDTTQWHQIFYSRCSVKSKVCNFIINMEVARTSF